MQLADHQPDQPRTTRGPKKKNLKNLNYLKNYFLKEPLRDWDVSRPARYFGFEIPDRPVALEEARRTRAS